MGDARWHGHGVAILVSDSASSAVVLRVCEAIMSIQSGRSSFSGIAEAAGVSRRTVGRAITNLVKSGRADRIGTAMYRIDGRTLDLRPEKAQREAWRMVANPARQFSRQCLRCGGEFLSEKDARGRTIYRMCYDCRNDRVQG